MSEVDFTTPYGALGEQVKVLIIGDYPSKAEAGVGRVFSAGTGTEYVKRLGENKLLLNTYAFYIFPSELSLNLYETSEFGTTLIPLFPEKKKDITGAHLRDHEEEKGLMVHSSVISLRERLYAHLRKIFESCPNLKVIVPIDNIALYFLTGFKGIHDWRGSIIYPNRSKGYNSIPTECSYVVIPFRPVSHLEALPSLKMAYSCDMQRIAKAAKELPPVPGINWNFLLQPIFEEAIAALKGLQALAIKGIPISIDIETRGIHIASIAFAWNSFEAICIPFMKVTSVEVASEEAISYFSFEEELKIIEEIAQLKDNLVVGQNFNFDAQIIFNEWGFLFSNVQDTMTQFHSIFSNVPKSLAFLSSMFLEDHLYWKDDRDESTWKDEGEVQFWRYNCVDAVRTWALHKALKDLLAVTKTIKIFEFQTDLQKAVLKMILRGINFNTENRSKLYGELRSLILEKTAELEYVLDIEGLGVNLNSSAQLKVLFYEYLQQRPVKVRRGTEFTVSTDVNALTQVAEREPLLSPVVDDLLNLRSLEVFSNTFLSAKTSEITNRIHTSFNICGTDTYRFSSAKWYDDSGLNFQNIPKGEEGEGLPNVRSLFLPDAGWTLFDTDLDSADLRIVTWESECKWMKEQFAAGNKPYVEIMREYYKDKTMTKVSHPEQYAKFKSLCHGTNYLGKADGLAKRLRLSVGEVGEIQKWYFRLNPEILEWQNNIKKRVNKGEPVVNVWGYKMYFWQPIEGTIYNQAVAWIPQSTVAILINKILVEVEKRAKDVKLLIQVHDSLVGQFPTEKKEESIKAIEECAKIALPYKGGDLFIPLGLGTSEESWGSIK